MNTHCHVLVGTPWSTSAGLVTLSHKLQGVLCEVFGGRELGTILDADARTQVHAQRRDRCGCLYNASGHLFDMVGDVCEGSWGTGSEVPFGC